MGSHAQPRGFDSHSIYHKLDDASRQIRLLRPITAFGESVMTFQLLVRRLAVRDCEASISLSGPPYRAISYTWGEGAPSRTVTVAGRNHIVSENCFNALWQARNRSPAALLWIDSICINQADSVEKSSQVQVMGGIYAQADVVYACVGPHADSSELVITASSNAERLDNIEAEANEEIAALKDSERRHLESETTESKFRHAMMKFRIRDYWSRLWSKSSRVVNSLRGVPRLLMALWLTR